MNAVIMGRKTWDSIPPKFRPLKGRLNIVISRSFAAPTPTAGAAETPSDGKEGAPAQVVDVETDAVRAGSLDQALAYLAQHPARPVARVFVIGGAQIYAAALALNDAHRVLLTRVVSDFECDTVFPIALGDDENASSAWVRLPHDEVSEWAGENVPAGLQEENGTSYEFQVWERAVNP
jgi:dihydrofolate reductase